MCICMKRQGVWLFAVINKILALLVFMNSKSTTIEYNMGAGNALNRDIRIARTDFNLLFFNYI